MSSMYWRVGTLIQTAPNTATFTFRIDMNPRCLAARFRATPSCGTHGGGFIIFHFVCLFNFAHVRGLLKMRDPPRIQAPAQRSGSCAGMWRFSPNRSRHLDRPNRAALVELAL